MIKADNKYNSRSNYKFIDLFAGIGGFRVALDSLGLSCVFSSEWDKEAQAVYKDNFGETPEGDITQIKSSDIPAHDVLCAGFPCQPFSISGKQRGFGDARGTLFNDIIRIAKHHQPKYLFLENVANMVSHDNGNTINTIIYELDKANYITHKQVLNASYFGIPQARKRLYFICVRKDFANMVMFSFPKPTYEKISLKDIALNDKETDKLTVKRNDITLEKNKLKLCKTNMLKPVRIGFLNRGGQGERIYHECGHAITLSAYGGGVGAKTGLYLINGKVRKLHPIECKRLMAFPDNFKIHPKPYQAYKQFGNAVVIRMIKNIFKQLLETDTCQRSARMLPLVKNQSANSQIF